MDIKVEAGIYSRLPRNSEGRRQRLWRRKKWGDLGASQEGRRMGLNEEGRLVINGERGEFPTWTLELSSYERSFNSTGDQGTGKSKLR